MARPRLAPGEYAGRPKGVVPVNFTLEQEALSLARQQAVSPKAIGRYLSRLIYEDEARRQERARLRRLIEETSLGN